MASLYELRELPVEGDYWLNTEGLVRQVNDNIYTVNLDNRTCSCTLFQENGIPCGYAITTISAPPHRGINNPVYAGAPYYCNLEQIRPISHLSISLTFYPSYSPNATLP